MGKLLRLKQRPVRFAFVRWVDPVESRYKAIIQRASGEVEAETEVGPLYLVVHALDQHFGGLPRVEDPENARDRRRFNAAGRRGGAS